jgi:ankyrin repeat protein
MLRYWLFVCTSPLVAAQTAKVDFARDIRPILQEHCYACHGPSQHSRGLRLDRRSSAFQIRGGVIIGRGNASGSMLYLRISGTTVGTRMPPTGALPAGKINLIRDWIDQGAEWPDSLAGEKEVPAADPKASRIMDALRHGDRAAFDGMLGDKDAINHSGTEGDTPLMYAALYGGIDSLRKLLDAGADPNLANAVGATPLMWAVEDPTKEKLLLDRGANANAVSDDGRTALRIALSRSDGEAAALLLLKRGAKLPVTEGSLADAARNEKILRAVIDQGASAKALEGGLSVAAHNGCDACIDLLAPLTDKAALRGALEEAEYDVSAARVKRLLELGADPNLEEMGKPLLMWFTTMRAEPVENVRLLLQHGAQVNAKSAEGFTALDYALRQGETPVAGVLRGFGATEGQQWKAPNIKPEPAASARAALARSIPLLQKVDVTFLQKSGCVSCHNNSLQEVAIGELRKAGVSLDEEIARRQLKAVSEYLEGSRERYLQGVSIAGESDTTNYLLLGLAAQSFPANAATDAMARFIRGQQRADGSWPIDASRPPIESSSIEVAAVSLRALQVYAPAPQREVYQESVRRAAGWLRSAQASTNEDRVFQLLGLIWASEKPSELRKMATALIAEQRADGGWAQIPTLTSDAYATGQALFALKTAGAVSSSDPVFQRGVKFLLGTQMRDGSWYVRSRTVALQPYFDSGFPYGSDQYISAAATNWAAIGLACGL